MLDDDPAASTAPLALLTPAEERFDRARRTGSLFLGPVLFVAMLAWPTPSLSPEAHALAAVLLWVVAWWIGEAIPIAATALLGPVLCVLLGIAEPAVAFAPFANPVIFLFLGSFLLAEAMVVHHLNERLALGVLSIRWLVAREGRLAIAVGLIPLSISMWISDSATTAMTYPIVLGLLAALRRPGAGRERARFEAGLLLTISYMALIGGTGTPVGTPPNLIGIAMLERLGGIRISFFTWMQLALPILVVMAACTLAFLRLAFPAPSTVEGAAADYIEERRRALGPWTRGEKNALAAFLVAVVLWVLPGLVASALGPGAPLTKACERHLPEGVASLAAALLLFVLPTDWRARRFTLSWSEAAGIDWGTILLFGGGLSLGGLMFTTGLADALGQGAIRASGARGLWAFTAVATALAILLTEITSNTATTSMLAPLVIALAKSLGVNPAPPVVGVCLGASMAFMLPVSTPSNAIVYGSGRVPITAMIRAGVVLDLVSFVVIVGMLRLLCPLLGLA